MSETIKIAGELESVATGGKVVDISNVKDKTKGNKSQAEINAEHETALADRYTKAETYNKSELNSMITTPNQEYVSVTATDQTTAATDVLPATGAADKVYRVGNWDGSQYDETCYSEYAWNGSAYVHLSTKTQIGEVFDISAYHATGGTLATYDNLNDALNGTNGGVPQPLQNGGMSVKFVQSSDNNYIQFRLMADEFSTTVSDWQGVDSKITDGSKNLIESGNVAYNFNSVGGELGDEIVGTSESENFEWAFFPCGIKKGETYIFRNGSVYADVATGNSNNPSQIIDSKICMGADVWVFKASADASFLMVNTKAPNAFSLKKQSNIQNDITLNSNECLGEWKSVFNETSYQVSVTSLFKQTNVIENWRYRIYIKGNYIGKFAVYNTNPLSVIYQTAESTDFSGGVTFDIVIPPGCTNIGFRTWEELTLDILSLDVLRADVSVSGIAFNKDTLATINIKGTGYPIKSNISSLDFIKANANIGTFDNLVSGWITGNGVLENYGNSGYYHAVLKVKPNDVVDITKGSQSAIVFVAKSYSFMTNGSSIDYSTVSPFNDKIVVSSSLRLVMPSDAAYLCIDGYSNGSSYLPSKVVINGVDSLAPINNRIATASQWGNKKIAFLGDSFVRRALEPQYYSVINNVIAMTNCISVNYGVAGTGFQREYDASSHRIPDRVAGMAGTEDAVVVIGMVNDYYYNIPLGTVSDAVSGDTFCAGVKLTIENLLAKYPSKPICFIPNSRVGKEIDNVVQMYLVNNGGVSGGEYIEKMKECCELYAIPFFDLYNTCGFNVENIEIFTDDLIHPNEVGCQFLSRKIVSFINSI